MRSRFRGEATPISPSEVSGTSATLLRARERTESPVLAYSESSRDASPSESAAVSYRQPAPRPVDDPTPPSWFTAVHPPATSSTATDGRQPPSAYERYADVFSRVYADAHSIAIALEVLDTYRAREVLTRPADQDLPKRVLAISASLFHVPVKRLLERNRRADVTSARYVAAWVLRRRGWSFAKIAALFGLDHSTIIHGIRKVATTSDLLLAALKAEQLVDDHTARAIADSNLRR